MSIQQTSRDEFIEYLKTLPQDVEISVIHSYVSGHETFVKEVPLNIDPIEGNVDFIDLTGNPHVNQGDPLENKKYLVLGET